VFELLPHRVVELGNAVPERCHPERRDGIEVALAVDVDQLVALGTGDDDGLVVERHRQAVSPSGEIESSTARDSFDYLSPDRLEAEARAALTGPGRARGASDSGFFMGRPDSPMPQVSSATSK